MLIKPDYYGGENNDYEAIKVIEAWGGRFNTGNAIKYISRAGKKDGNSLAQDLTKALYYLKRAHERCEAYPFQFLEFVKDSEKYQWALVSEKWELPHELADVMQSIFYGNFGTAAIKLENHIKTL